MKQIYIITHAETRERKVQSEFFFETINHFNLNMVVILISSLSTGSIKFGGIQYKNSIGVNGWQIVLKLYEVFNGFLLHTG